MKTLNLSKNLQKKFNHLQDILKSYESVLVGFSGGADSTLLSYVAYNILAQKSLITTINSEFYPAVELKETLKVAEVLNIPIKILELKVLNHSDVIKNDKLRCKYCKTYLFKQLIELKDQQGINYVCDGSNVADLNDYRPGFEAIKELRVKSPFIEANINKQEIREISLQLNLPNWDKPSQACLASRIPYDTCISSEVLKQVEKAEKILIDLGYKTYRVRHHNEIARIELHPDDSSQFIQKHSEFIDKEFKKLNYNYVCLDLKGYVSGSLNGILKKSS